MSKESLLVLPRPGESTIGLSSPATPHSIAAPLEALFTSTFGSLLPKASFVTNNAGSFAYYSLTPEEKSAHPPRILLLHGIQTPAIGLFPLTSALRKSFPRAHLVILDWWGHGLSSTPVCPHETSLFIGQVDALLEQLAWQKAHLVAFSFGCSIAAAYTAYQPGRVESLALVAPAGLMRSETWGKEANDILTGQRGEVAARDWILNFLEGGPLLVPDDWRQRVARGEVVSEAVREWQMREHQGHTATVVGIFRDGGVNDRHETFTRASRTGVEAVVILGGDDDICNSTDVEGVGFNDVKVIDGVGHGVVRQRAGEVAALIGDFWNRIRVQ